MIPIVFSPVCSIETVALRSNIFQSTLVYYGLIDNDAINKLILGKVLKFERRKCLQPQ